MELKDNLEKWVIEYQAAGQAWVAAKLKADQLDEFSKSLLSKIMNAFEETAIEAKEKITESKLERLALGSGQYIDHVKAVVLAKSDMLSKRVRFDAMDKWFEAKRSGLSFEKEIIKKGIFDTGIK
jgi:signal recognition particle GTPase